MNQHLELNEDDFADRFKPIANHLNPNASFDWGQGFGTLFETYDEELDFVRSQRYSNIWTLLSGDDGDSIASGFHFVNRLGYFITAEAVPDGVTYDVSLNDEIYDVESVSAGDEPLLKQSSFAERRLP